MNLKSLTIFAISALVFCACESENPYAETEEIGPYTVSLIEPNVWHVEDCTADYPHGMSKDSEGNFRFKSSSDMYIVKGKKKAILIDLSNKIDYAENADEALRKIFYDRAGNREKLVTVTHNHGDHTGMAYAFNDQPDITYVLPVNDFQNDSQMTGKVEYLSDMDIIDLGGMKLQCVQCEGHTPGSMVFFLKGHDIAFSGDAVGSGTGVWLFNMDCYKMFANGVKHLNEYVQNPANGFDPKTLYLWGGHTYQNQDFPLDGDFIAQMAELVDQLAAGTAEGEPYPQMAFRGLDTTFKNGNASIVWNKALSEELVK